VAVSLVILFFVYAFYYLPHTKAPQPSPAVSAALAPGKTQAPEPAGNQVQPSPPVQPETAAAPPPAQAPLPPEKPGGPRLVVVIDDLGGSLDQARDLLDLGLPVTFSILPDLPHTTEVDAMAAKAGMEVILHQPMSAQGQIPESPGTLRPGMTVPETAAILDAHLAQLPHAAGVSNHEGSAATQDPALMAAVMVRLKARGLFFLDSLTTPKSAAGKEAAREGVPALGRNVFLDNERGQQAAILMLAQAEREARAKGRAVAIGHPYPETIAALSAWNIRRDKGVQLVSLGRLLKGN
jgi:hypothetical protein